MILELILTAALTTTGGQAVNDSPSNVWEGVSGCAAHVTIEAQESCTQRVVNAWTPYMTPADWQVMETLQGTQAAVAYEVSTQPPAVEAPSAYTPPAASIAPPVASAPQSAPPVKASDTVPVVSGNGMETGEWVAPDWCGFPGLAADQPVEHDSGLDWSEVTENWTDEQVGECF